jgi:type IV pilus assembly protein PilQ
VLVQSGSTLVIGGIYTMDVTSSEGGFPWLKDIPIIGSLFKSESSQTNRSELFIFVTPKVINAKKAGLAS